MRRRNKIKSPSAGLKRKALKKFNVLNIGIAAVCIFVGYIIAVFLNPTQGNWTKHNSVDEITQSAVRIADSFEFYNQKRFLNAVVPDRGGLNR